MVSIRSCGRASPVGSISTRSGCVSSTAPSASSKPSGAVQQTQPPGIAVRRKGEPSSSVAASSEASPKSFTMMAMRSPRRASSCARSALVFPAPRNPATTWTGTPTSASPLSDSLRELQEERLRLLPAETLVGDALPVDQRRARLGVLAAVDQEALDHDAHQRVAPRLELVADVGHHIGLARVVLAAVGVAAVDHHVARQGGVLERRDDALH